jgi:hypothetical protein
MMFSFLCLSAINRNLKTLALHDLNAAVAVGLSESARYWDCSFG